MNTYRVTLARQIVVEVDAVNPYDAYGVALLAHSNGEFNELWDGATAYPSGISSPIDKGTT
jgi:hypothetical protein